MLASFSSRSQPSHLSPNSSYLEVLQSQVRQYQHDLRELQHLQLQLEKESVRFGYDNSEQLQQLQDKILKIALTRDECQRAIKNYMTRMEKAPTFATHAPNLPSSPNTCTPRIYDPPISNQAQEEYGQWRNSLKETDYGPYEMNPIGLPSATDRVYESRRQGQWLMISRKAITNEAKSPYSAEEGRHQTKVIEELWNWHGRPIVVQRRVAVSNREEKQENNNDTGSPSPSPSSHATLKEKSPVTNDGENPSDNQDTEDNTPANPSSQDEETTETKDAQA